MEIKDPFRDYLIKKREEGGKSHVDWEAEKDNWLHSLMELYSDIENWLKSYYEEGLVKLERKSIIISEPEIGQYNADELDIYLGKDIVRLIPVGTIIVGSRGRIDMKGPNDEYMIILGTKDWQSWSFAKKFPQVRLWEVNEASFKKAILDVING